ncbi:uncharacterized protein LOC134209285 [Armigeres subalbatus]|uniref:uncharacterized protein LOC134209285 n=1 Tax=Armigeres subalbatus TaxID=124917 RepID=UPI002ED21111
MGRKCEFYFCGNHQGIPGKLGKVSFYSFPKNQALCSLWVESCNSPEASDAFKSQGYHAFLNKKLCSDHFSLSSFRDSTNKNKGLVAGAVPSSRAKIGFENLSEDVPKNVVDGRDFSSEPNETTIEFIDGDDDFARWFQSTQSKLSPEKERDSRTIVQDQLHGVMEIRPDNHTGTEDEAPPFGQFSDNPNKNIPPVVSSETSLRQSLKSRELTIKLLKQNMKSIRRQMFVQDQTSKRRLNASNRLGSHVQMKFVEKSVMAIRKIGLIPIALVMDQCTTNQKMIREAGATHADPLINIGGEDIAVLYDTPHLLKNTRNALLKHNAVFEGGIASFQHIKELYDTDVTSSLRLVPKLNHKCITLPPFTKMNVPLAYVLR